MTNSRSPPRTLRPISGLRVRSLSASRIAPIRCGMSATSNAFRWSKKSASRRARHAPPASAGYVVMTMERLKALPFRLAVLPPRLASTNKATSWTTEGRASRHERGYGKEWDRLRKQILLRDGGLCLTCLREGVTTAAYAVDHVIPKTKGGTDDETNLASICRPCHSTKSAAEAKRGRKRVAGPG